MIRIVIENLLLFLLPALAYIAYRILTTGSTSAGQHLDDAPFVWLFVSGAMMVVVSLVVFGSTSGGRPGEAYVPPSMRDGRIVPGHRIEQNETIPARPSTMRPSATKPAAAPAAENRSGG